MIHWNMIFSDETGNFCTPAEPEKGEKVALRLRAAKGDVLKVSLCSGQERTPMRRRQEKEGAFDFYEGVTPPLWEPFSYHYEIYEEKDNTENADSESIRYFNRLGLVAEADPAFDFCLIPGFCVPEWMKGAVIYQIYVDRFCRGNARTDVQTGEFCYLAGRQSEHCEDWEEMPHPWDVNRFYGGDLPGVLEHLDELKSLGVEALYFNPLFVSPSNHKYDTQDYDHIDPHLTVIPEDKGRLLYPTEADNRNAERYRKRTTDPVNLEASDAYFAHFIEEAHRRGIRVIMDGVFNHCGSFHKWMNREQLYRAENGYAEGAFSSANSPYREYFRFDADGRYECWWGHETLPKLNYEGSEALCEEILRIGRKWVSPPYSADGWRLDVAADLGHSPEFNHRFWQRFREAVKEANPNAVILAEHYGDVRPWLSGSEWDTVMNYDAFMEPVTWFLTGMEKHSDAAIPEREGDCEGFWRAIRRSMASFSYGSLHTAMNQLDNHDHSRFITRTNGRTGRLESAGSAAAGEGIRMGVYRQAIVMQFTWPGAPTLYYGDETGLPGWTDPDDRRTFPWNRRDWELEEFCRYMIRLHRESPALRKGSLLPLPAEEGVLAYGRFLAEEKALVVIHHADEERKVSLDLTPLGVESGWLERRMETKEKEYNVGVIWIPIREGRTELVLKPQSALYFQIKNEPKHIDS